jgi:hypothetical protein
MEFFLMFAAVAMWISIQEDKAFARGERYDV